MDSLSKDADYRDYELFLESLKPSDEDLEFWLEDMYKNKNADDRKQNSESLDE